jgi:hypothetical protein
MPFNQNLNYALKIKKILEIKLLEKNLEISQKLIKMIILYVTYEKG